MAFVLKDRVRDTTTTTGTGAVTLSGTPPTAFQAFGSVLATNDTCYYTIAHQSSNEWETGLGTYNSVGPTLTRTTVFESSNAGSAVTFSAGTKDVFISLPASRFLPFTFRLNADLAGSNATGAQNIFGKGVTLLASTIYAFDIVFGLSKAAGTTSHNISLGFGGTASLNNIYWGPINPTSVVASGFVAAQTAAFSSATLTVSTGALTTAATRTNFRIKGSVSINASGTFIPQYSLSAAPGGAYSTLAGSYVQIWPIGAAGADINIGGWA